MGSYNTPDTVLKQAPKVDEEMKQTVVAYSDLRASTDILLKSPIAVMNFYLIQSRLVKIMIRI